MSLAERLREKARDYELRAVAHADRPDAGEQLAALTFSAVAMTLYELAQELEADESELELEDVA